MRIRNFLIIFILGFLGTGCQDEPKPAPRVADFAKINSDFLKTFPGIKAVWTAKSRTRNNKETEVILDFCRSPFEQTDLSTGKKALVHFQSMHDNVPAAGNQETSFIIVFRSVNSERPLVGGVEFFPVAQLLKSESNHWLLESRFKPGRCP